MISSYEPGKLVRCGYYDIEFLNN